MNVWRQLWCLRHAGALLAVTVMAGAQEVGEAEAEAAAATTGAEVFAGIFAREISAPGLAGVAVGMAVLDEDGREWFVSESGRTAMCPASALKILTTGAALGILGPEYRFETRLAGTAEIDGDGTLNGDLVIVGSGDPGLSVARLRALAGRAVASGLKRVTGTVRADVSCFPEHPMSEHWNWGDIGNAYGAGAFGLNVNRNRMEVRLRPGAEPGAPIEVLGSEPEVRGLKWINLATTGPVVGGDGIVVYSVPYGTDVTLRGTLPAGVREWVVAAAIPDPPALAVDLVRSYLEERGVEIGGEDGLREEAPVVDLAVSRSQPLAGMVDRIHRTSDNVESQCLFLAMAAGGDPVRVVRRFWENAGVEFVSLRMIDGSGLARANMIRPLDLAAVAHAAAAMEHGERFLAGLPAGQGGRVRSKPGGMSGVSTSAGFITTGDGRRMSYALLVNGLTVPGQARELMRNLREAVARHAAREDGAGR